MLKDSILLGSLSNLGSSSLALSNLVLGLDSHDTSTPGTANLIGLLSKVGVDGGNQSSQRLLVLGIDASQSQSGSSLLVDNGTQTRLALNNAVWNSHLAAQSRKPDNKL